MALTISSKYYKAMLDTIAYTEGTLGASQNGYDILFNLYTINGWTPNCDFGHQGKDWLVESGAYKSTAAGRYQFLSKTWWGLSDTYKNELNLVRLTTPNKSENKEFYYNAPFNKQNQNYLAYKLLQSTRHVSESDLIKASNSVTDFGNMIKSKKLDCEWSSLIRALPTGSPANCSGAGTSSSVGQVKNKQVCQPPISSTGCQSGAEEIWVVYNKALKKY